MNTDGILTNYEWNEKIENTRPEIGKAEVEVMRQKRYSVDRSQTNKMLSASLVQ